MTYNQKYQTFYHSRRWKELRKTKLFDCDYLCEECKKNGIVKAGTQVHHIVPIEQDWNLRLDYDNLQVLCVECHNEKHDRSSGLHDFLKEWDKDED